MILVVLGTVLVVIGVDLVVLVAVLVVVLVVEVEGKFLLAPVCRRSTDPIPPKSYSWTCWIRFRGSRGSKSKTSQKSVNRLAKT